MVFKIYCTNDCFCYFTRMENSCIHGEGLPETAADWLGNTLGSYSILQNCRTDSNRTGVWKIEADGKCYYMKLNRRRIRWATELFAYRNWMTHLAPFTPQLHGVLDRNGICGLLLSSLDGTTMRETSLTEDQAVKAYHMAGKLLARLHSLPGGPWFGIMDENGRPAYDNFSQNPTVYYHCNLENGLNEAKVACALNADEEGTAQAVAAAIDKMKFGPPVPTFFDYTPGNWIVNASGEFTGIIDFENMAWGLPADPFARLLIDYFPNCPKGKESFYAGYGRRMDIDCPEQICIGGILYALYYKTQGVLQNRPDMIERGQRGFTRCRELGMA